MEEVVIEGRPSWVKVAGRWTVGIPALDSSEWYVIGYDAPVVVDLVGPPVKGARRADSTREHQGHTEKA